MMREVGAVQWILILEFVVVDDEKTKMALDARLEI